MLNGDASWSVLAVSLLAVAVAALFIATRLKVRRAGRAAPLQAHIETSKAELDQLNARLAAGEITRQAFDEQARGLACGLLGSAAAAASVVGQPSGSKKGLFVLAALLLVALVGGVLYLSSGRVGEAPGGATVAVPGSLQPAAEKPAHALSDEQLQRTIEQATIQVRTDPKDAAAWAMLAHSYDMLGKFAESSKAYATLAQLVPDDAQVLADYADALAVANGRTLAGEPAALVKKALAIDASNLKALALAGTAAFERKDYSDAVSAWERARAVSTDATFKQQIELSIAEARAAAKGEVTAVPAAAMALPGSAAAAAGGTAISGRVSLADDLVAKASPDATVFIFARPVKGSRMPVALLRKHVRDLPIDFTLDDSMAMVKDLKLSQVPTVVVGARVSMRGDVMPQPGDMQGWSAPVTAGTKGIKLEISEVLK